MNTPSQYSVIAEAVTTSLLVHVTVQRELNNRLYTGLWTPANTQFISNEAVKQHRQTVKQQPTILNRLSEIPINRDGHRALIQLTNNEVSCGFFLLLIFILFELILLHSYCKHVLGSRNLAQNVSITWRLCLSSLISRVLFCSSSCWRSASNSSIFCLKKQTYTLIHIQCHF